MKIKTIDIQAKEWFDKTYGNSYFSAQVTINYGLKSAVSWGLPYQYGYGEQYIHEAFKSIRKKLNIKVDEHTQLWRYCEENKIILRTSKQTGCKKKELT